MTVKTFILESVGTGLSFFRIMKNLKYKKTLSPKTTDDTLIILGTGPSLQTVLEKHMEEITLKETMAVNKFSTRGEFELLKPKHYVLLDAVFSTKEVLEEYIAIREAVFNTLIEKTSWNMTVYIPSNSNMRDEINNRFSHNIHLHIVYFHMTTVEGLGSVVFPLYQKGYGMPFAGNVLVAALSLAIGMGYKKIILCGADLSMHKMAAVDKHNQLCLEETNFYDKSNECKALHEKVSDYYYKIARSFEAFQRLQAYAEHQHVKIVNSSMESFIDAFEKKKMSEILKD